MPATACPADEAFGKNKVSCDLSGGLCDSFTELEGTTLTYGDKGAVFSIEKGTNAPTIRTGKFLFFGRVDFEIQASEGNGIVTSAVLQSDDLDEIDWEWVGGDVAKVQTNYFSKGDTTTYDRGKYHDVSAALTSFHTYSIEWTSASVIWLIDDAPVRTLTYEDAKGGAAFPQTPMEVKVGTWCAGLPSTPEGTRDWAGGLTDFSQGPFNAYYKSISIVDYAGKDAPTKDSVKEYIYGDKTGTWESIKVVKGDGSGDDDTTTTTKAKPTTTSTTTKAKPTTTKVKTTTTTEAESTTTSEAESTTSTTKSSTKSTKTKTSAVSTVTSVFTTTTSAPASTTTDSSDAPASTTEPAPAETTTDVPDAAPRSVATLGGAALAAAFVMFAML